MLEHGEQGAGGTLCGRRGCVVRIGNPGVSPGRYRVIIDHQHKIGHNTRKLVIAPTCTRKADTELTHSCTYIKTAFPSCSTDVAA